MYAVLLLGESCDLSVRQVGGGKVECLRRMEFACDEADRSSKLLSQG